MTYRSKEIGKGVAIFLFLLSSAVLLTGVLDKEIARIKGRKEKPVFEKSYMVSRYPKAGSDTYLYVVDFQFDTVEALVDWLQKYEELRRKEDVKISNEENAGK